MLILLATALSLGTVVLQVALWLAGAMLLWIGGRFIAKVPNTTFRRSLLTYFLAGTAAAALSVALLITARQLRLDPCTTVILLGLAGMAVGLFISWLVIRMKVPRTALVVFVVHAAVLLILYSLGAFVLSDGWGYIGSSPHRDILYKLALYVIPAVVAVSVVHVLMELIDGKTLVRSMVFAVFFGLLGPLTLHILIQTSDDGVAVMAYMGLWICYVVFFVMGFIALCVVLSVVKCIPAEPAKPSANTKSGGNIVQ